VYLEQVSASRMVRTSIEPGSRVYPHATKVLLAHQPEEVVDSIVRQNGLPRFSPCTITDIRQFTKELEKARQQGYVTGSEEKEEGGSVLGHSRCQCRRAVVAAMSISDLASRLDEARLEELIPHIKWRRQHLLRKPQRFGVTLSLSFLDLTTPFEDVTAFPRRSDRDRVGRQVDISVSFSTGRNTAFIGEELAVMIT
jgi:hypothetical protein